jgi:hypothetical protein
MVVDPVNGLSASEGRPIQRAALRPRGGRSGASCGGKVKLKKVLTRRSIADAETEDAETGVRRVVVGRAVVGRAQPEPPGASLRDSWDGQDSGRGREGRVSSIVPRPPLLQPDSELATTLVIMEAGASWPVWVKELQRRAPNSMVEVQPSSESPDSFASRVLRRLDALRGRRVELLGAVYAAASPASEDERRVRWRLCEALLDALSPRGELILSGANWSTWGVDARSREDLLGLAGDLSCELRVGTQTVSVRFEDPVEESGMHKAGSPSAAHRGSPDGGRTREIA